MSNRTCAIYLMAVVLVSGCVSAPQTHSLLDEPPDGIQSEIRLAHVPFFPQDDYQCGPAALATVLVSTGVDITPDQLTNEVYVPGKQGSYQLELVTAARRYGRLAYELEPELRAVLDEIEAGNPVLVMQNLGLKIAPQWHFAVMKGFDLEKGRVILNSGEIEDYSLSMKVFERTWARSNHWAVVMPPPGSLPVTASPEKVFEAIAALEHSSDHSEVLGEYYLEALDQWPQNSQLLFAYGNLLYNQGDSVGAESLYSILTRIDRQFAPGFNNMAWLLYEQGRLEEAVIFSARAVELTGPFQETAEETHNTILLALEEQKAESVQN